MEDQPIVPWAEVQQALETLRENDQRLRQMGGRYDLDELLMKLTFMLVDRLRLSSLRLEHFTKRLFWLTFVLSFLTAILAYDVIRRLDLQFHLDLRIGRPPSLMVDAVTGLTITLAIAGTLSQIAGSRLAERGTPPDDPWASLRGDDFLSQEPAIRAQGKRWRDRLWGSALGLAGTMLLLDSVMVSLLTGRLSRLAAPVLIACPLIVAAWSLWGAWRQSQGSIRRENETVNDLHKKGKA